MTYEEERVIVLAIVVGGIFGVASLGLVCIGIEKLIRKIHNGSTNNTTKQSKKSI